VASAEFAARGYDGARVDEIVRQCMISKNLLYYYFGSKERLFVASLEAAYAAIRSRQAAVVLNGLAPADGIRKLIGEMFRHLAEVPEFIGLLNSENLHKAMHLQNSAAVRGAYPPMVQKLSELLQQGKASGTFRSDADAVDLYIAISGMSYHALSNQYTLSVLFDRDFSAPAQVAWRIEHITDVILGYLRFAPEENPIGPA
jgi:TetR/AcrR family transcriptional regulator